MTTSSGRPLFASDDWMHEQQVRAELEAEAWRRLRLDLAAPPAQPASAPAPITPPAASAPAAVSAHHTGSTLLKALVRFVLGAFGGYLAYLAAVDGGLGEVEIWLATASGFVVTMALSMFSPMRGFVHFLAETMRWVIILGVGFGALWVVMQMQGHA